MNRGEQQRGKASPNISLANPGSSVPWSRKLHCPIEQESYANERICMAALAPENDLPHTGSRPLSSRHLPPEDLPTRESQPRLPGPGRRLWGVISPQRSYAPPQRVDIHSKETLGLRCWCVKNRKCGSLSTVRCVSVTGKLSGAPISDTEGRCEDHAER